MRKFDAVVIGGGVLGCFAARNLCRWRLKVALVEAKADICTEITRANAAIVYSGCDHKPGSLKAAMTVRANEYFGELCDQLEVPFRRCGSLMVCYGTEGMETLRKKLRQGRENGVRGLMLMGREETLEAEPMLSNGIIGALYAPSTGVVNPWQLGIAAYENAIDNGCEAVLNAPVRSISRAEGGYLLEMNGFEFWCRAVVNCAGMQADRVREMLFEPSVRIEADGADGWILDENAPAPQRVIFQETEARGKGITATPTTDGNLMLISAARPLGHAPFGTDREGLKELRAAAGELFPGLDQAPGIRSFGAVRPNPRTVVLRDGKYVWDGKSIGSFVMEHPEPGFFGLIGVKTPGLTCADELGRYLAEGVARTLEARENDGFRTNRKSIQRVRGLDTDARAALVAKDRSYGDVICRCGDITRGEIIEAVRRGAVDFDGVKRRVGAGLGRCQGSRCRLAVEKLLEGYRNGVL